MTTPGNTLIGSRAYLCSRYRHVPRLTQQRRRGDDQEKVTRRIMYEKYEKYDWCDKCDLTAMCEKTYLYAMCVMCETKGKYDGRQTMAG